MKNRKEQDGLWWALIAVSLRHYKRIGRFPGRSGQRYDRRCVYVCRSCYELAFELREEEILMKWDAGMTRLHRIHDDARQQYRDLHGGYHTDPEQGDLQF